MDSNERIQLLFVRANELSFYCAFNECKELKVNWTELELRWYGFYVGLDCMVHEYRHFYHLIPALKRLLCVSSELVLCAKTDFIKFSGLYLDIDVLLAGLFHPFKTIRRPMMKIKWCNSLSDCIEVSWLPHYMFRLISLHINSIFHFPFPTFFRWPNVWCVAKSCDWKIQCIAVRLCSVDSVCFCWFPSVRSIVQHWA